MKRVSQFLLYPASEINRIGSEISDNKVQKKLPSELDDNYVIKFEDKKKSFFWGKKAPAGMSRSQSQV